MYAINYITTGSRPIVDMKGGDAAYIDFVRQEDGVEIERYNRDWLLSRQGDMYCNNDYDIPASRLTEDDWLLHLMEKGWFDANTFIPAYFEALRRANIKIVTIRVEY